MRDVGLPLAPTFVAFTPWTTLEGYLDLLQTIADLDLVEAVASIQLAIRLLLPAGSRLMELPEIRALAGSLDPTALAHAWEHPDPRVDQLQRDVQRLVGRTAPRAARGGVRRGDGAGAVRPPANARDDTDQPRAARATVPFLTEPWYC